MWPVGHLAVAYLSYQGLQGVRGTGPSAAGATLALAVGSQLPDLVDELGPDDDSRSLLVAEPREHLEALERGSGSCKGGQVAPVMVTCPIPHRHHDGISIAYAAVISAFCVSRLGLGLEAVDYDVQY